MTIPTEHKIVQAHIIAYVPEIGWRYMPRAGAEMRRGFGQNGDTLEDRARSALN